jgi:hypothetical protein
MTRTEKLSGAPGMGVQGVGWQTSAPSTNGTETVVDPGATAVSVAVKDAPSE